CSPRRITLHRTLLGLCPLGLRPADPSAGRLPPASSRPHPVEAAHGRARRRRALCLGASAQPHPPAHHAALRLPLLPALPSLPQHHPAGHRPRRPRHHAGHHHPLTAHPQHARRPQLSPLPDTPPLTTGYLTSTTGAPPRLPGAPPSTRTGCPTLDAHRVPHPRRDFVAAGWWYRAW